ncbi:MAG: tetratricopeptide repeat protein [Geminicoccaceae bacterium]
MTPDQQDLLQALAFLYLRHGQQRRALTLILLAARHAPDDVGVLRTLAYAFIANDAADEALDVIERLEQMDFDSESERVRCLLKARALLHAGRRVEAKAVFREFVRMRRLHAEGQDKTEVEGEVLAADEAATAPTLQGLSKTTSTSNLRAT